MWKPLTLTFCSLLVSGCMQPPQEPAIPIDGSRNDGVVVSQMRHNPNLGYRPDYTTLRNSAKQACLRWGFRNAAPFGEPAQMCEEYGANGRCASVQITQKYQCSVM